MSEEHDDEFFTADNLRRLGSDYARLKREESVHAADVMAEAKRKHLDELMQPVTVTDEMRNRFLQRLKATAESGQNRLLAMRFPSELCSDQGRAISDGKVDWPDTLVGKPRQLFEVWKNELKPRGYAIRADILDFVDGMPGDAGLYVTW